MMTRQTLEKAFSAALAERTRTLGDEAPDRWSFEDDDVLPEQDDDYDPEVNLAVTAVNLEMGFDE